jgi:hypothetical protein
VIDYWGRLPEFIRWILLLPAVLLSWLVANLWVHVIVWAAQWVGGPTPTSPFAAAMQAGISAGFLFTVVFALAPRGKRVVGWFFYVVMTLFAGFALLFMTARRLAMWGLLEHQMLTSPGDWTSTDTREFIQSLVWVTFGTFFFRKCLGEHPREPKRTQLARSAAGPSSGSNP